MQENNMVLVLMNIKLQLEMYNINHKIKKIKNKKQKKSPLLFRLSS